MWPFKKKSEPPAEPPEPKANGSSAPPSIPDFDEREDTARITLKLAEYQKKKKACAEELVETAERVDDEVDDFSTTMRSLPAVALPGKKP